MNPVLPQDNTFDLTIITDKLKLNAELLMQEMTAHASKLMGEDLPTMWWDIKDRQPRDHYKVLVARDHYGDEAYDYFVADYWGEEDGEWQVFLTMPGVKGCNYVRVTIPVKEGDVWTYFKGVSEG